MIWEDLLKPWVTIAKGSVETFKEMVSPAVTRMYPAEPTEVKGRWRGPLRLRGVMDDLETPITDAGPLEFNDLMTALHERYRVAPCMGGCPANVDARGQNAMCAEGRFVEAYQVVRRRNILPGVLGYVCNNPCEDVCRRSHLDDPIAIRQLHRECYEVYDQQVRRPGHLRNLVYRNEHVAIIGAGPAGLAVGYDLIQLGYRATIYEREKLPGGLLTTSVPLYRLPREVTFREIADLEEMGLRIEYGVEVGKDVTLDELRATHDAVVVAVGYSAGRKLPLEGADAEGVWAALDFLYDYCMGKNPKVGPTVVTIGGGDVAADCSRSSLRTGATRSIQSMLEVREEMPGQDIEVEGAIEEGVELWHRWGPGKVLVEDGRCVGIRLRKISSRFDETGKWNPQFTGEELDVRCETVIFAVGQALDIPWLEDTGVEFDPVGRPLSDPLTGECGPPGVFLAGDLATGPRTIIIAMGHGHEVAISVDRYLQGRDLKDDRRPPVHPPEYYLQKMYGKSPDELLVDTPGGRRVRMPESDPHQRIKSNMQVELGWPKGDGHREAVRCMRCQTHVCVACTMCARVCPDNCIDVRGYDTGYERIVTRYDFVMEWCCFCGLCEDICPTQTLDLAPSFDYARASRRFFTYDREFMLRPFRGPDVFQNRDGWP
jgi:glutamate synthase (NADPH) small chain